MLKNIYFACCMAIASSFLYMSNAIASESEVPEAIVGIINDYVGNEPRIIEDSKRTIPHKLGFVDSCFLSEDDQLIKELKPEDYIYSLIDDRHFDITVMNMYHSRLKPHRLRCFTRLINHCNHCNRRRFQYTEEKASWYLGDYPYSIQTQHTRENQGRFGSNIVPDRSSASFFPNQQMLIVANHENITTYETTNQSYEAIDNGLNSKIFSRRLCNKITRRALFSGMFMIGAAAAYASSSPSSQSK